MPYLKKEDRERILMMNHIDINEIKCGGDLQYAISEMIVSLLKARGEYRYKDIEEVMGALSGAQQEFYREVAAPYEDLKIAENGAVYADLRKAGSDEY